MIDPETGELLHTALEATGKAVMWRTPVPEDWEGVPARLRVPGILEDFGLDVIEIETKEDSEK